jgi:tryptophan synthase alpha chain
MTDPNILDLKTATGQARIQARFQACATEGR